MVVRGKLPQIEYSETALFCLCCSFLLYAVVLDPKLLFTGYYYSILKWSRDYTEKKLNIVFRVPGDQFLTCKEVGIHKDGCMKHAIKDFFQSIPAFAKLYFPIHVTPIIIFRRKLLVQRYVLLFINIGEYIFPHLIAPSVSLLKTIFFREQVRSKFYVKDNMELLIQTRRFFFLVSTSQKQDIFYILFI